MLNGSAKFGVADPTFVAVSAARGQNGKVVASLVNGVPFWGITFRDIAPLTDAKELIHYSVATFPSPSTAYTLQKKMFTDAGLTPLIFVKARSARLSQCSVRAKPTSDLSWNPTSAKQSASARKSSTSLAERYGDFAITGVTATDVTVKQDPALVEGVRAALQGALDLLHSNPDKALTFLLKAFPRGFSPCGQSGPRAGVA